MRIASWNVNSLKARLEHVQRFLAPSERSPDVLGLQELKLADDKFPLAAIEGLGYQAVWAGQPAYNGVALLSRIGIAEVDRGGELDIPEQRRLIAGTVGSGAASVRVINLYAVNGQEVGSEKFELKLRWFEQLKNYLAVQLELFPRLLVMGDFNIAPTALDVHDPVAWHEQVLCSEVERRALRSILDLGLSDSLRLKHDAPKLYSWWDYRALAFRRNRGLRIDLVLISQSLLAELKDAGIDKEPRKWDRPSDHAPVWIELAP
jgi:exodeoxyribonuclease-3